MKRKLIFIVPTLALLGLLAIKPPAIGNQTGQVVVTPEATTTPLSQPNLRDFDDDGHGPRHEDFDGDEAEHEERHGDREHHGEHHDDEDESDEDDYDQED